MQQREFMNIDGYARAEYRAVYEAEGWLLARSVYRPGESKPDELASGLMRTARGQIRQFKSLDSIAVLLAEHDVHQFRVILP